jgi:hypothetical protein
MQSIRESPPRFLTHVFLAQAEELALSWSWKDPFASSIAAPLREPAVWLLRVGWTGAKAPSRLSAIDAFLRAQPDRHLC